MATRTQRAARIGALALLGCFGLGEALAQLMWSVQSSDPEFYEQHITLEQTAIRRPLAGGCPALQKTACGDQCSWTESTLRMTPDWPCVKTVCEPA